MKRTLLGYRAAALLSFALLLLRSPRSALARLKDFVRVLLERRRGPVPPPLPPQALPAALDGLQRQAGPAAGQHLGEPELIQLLEDVSAQARRLPGGEGIIGFHHRAGGRQLVRAVYALCRALRPAIVVETGVSYGASTAAILSALQQNGDGVLHSVDRPPLSGPDTGRTGLLVPERLRDRWRLHVGSSRELLPGVLDGAAGMSLFIHDSLHTYSNMRFELGAALAALARPGVILVDDIDDNHAFADWIEAAQPAFRAVIEQPAKDTYLGLAYFD